MSMSTAAFEDEFFHDPMHRMRWNAFLNKKKALIQIPLEEVISNVKKFAAPLFDENSEWEIWNPQNRMWEND